MIKIGFIGTGGISGAHMKCLQHRKDVKIAALCDINREQALKRQKEFGGDVFADFNEKLDTMKPDAVWICTPPSVRREPKFPVLRSTPVMMPLVRTIRSGKALMFANSCGMVIDPIVLSTAIRQ